MIADRFYQTWAFVVPTINVDEVPRTLIKPFSSDLIHIFIVIVLKTVVRLQNWNDRLLLTGTFDTCPLAERLGLEA